MLHVKEPNHEKFSKTIPLRTFAFAVVRRVACKINPINRKLF